MDFIPHSNFFECWSARSPLDNQGGIFRQLLVTARLAEFPSLYLLVCEAIDLIPSHTISSMDSQNHNKMLPLSSCHFWFMRPVTWLTIQVEKRTKTTTKFYWPLFRAGLNHILWRPDWDNGRQYKFKLSFTSPSIEELASNGYESNLDLTLSAKLVLLNSCFKLSSLQTSHSFSRSQYYNCCYQGTTGVAILKLDALAYDSSFLIRVFSMPVRLQC